MHKVFIVQLVIDQVCVVCLFNEFHQRLTGSSQGAQRVNDINSEVEVRLTAS